MRKIITVLAMVLMITGFVSAHGEDTLAEGEEIVDQKIPCENLTDEQLEAVGDYYMEQMHPGEEHERMDSMMGGEGSESLRNMHINMARSMYCGQHEAMGPGMMNQMMQGPSQQNSSYWTVTNILYVVILIGLVALIFTGVVKFWKESD